MRVPRVCRSRLDVGILFQGNTNLLLESASCQILEMSEAMVVLPSIGSCCGVVIQSSKESCSRLASGVIGPVKFLMIGSCSCCFPSSCWIAGYIIASNCWYWRKTTTTMATIPKLVFMIASGEGVKWSLCYDDRPKAKVIQYIQYTIQWWRKRKVKSCG